MYSGIEVEISDDDAIAIRQITRNNCRRFISSAADWAKKYDIKKMVAITKRNILKKTDGIFWSEMENCIKENPGIALELSLIHI